VTDTGIARIFAFSGGPDLIAAFGLLPVHPATDPSTTDRSFFVPNRRS
jgi:hypothetical protein